jgi:hypothetical protein
MQKTGARLFLKWIWIAGVVVWASVVLFLLWRLPNAQSYAEASFNSTRLFWVAVSGIFWAIAAAIWQGRLKRERASQD